MTHSLTISQVAVPWAPSRQLPAGLIIADLHHDIWSGVLNISLGHARSIDLPPALLCRVYFNKVFAFRVMEDSDMSDGMSSHPVEEQIQIITPSRFVAWFHQESKGVHLDEDIQHYRISTWDRCVDVLTSSPPELKMQQ
ncbi:hypothetical protein [Aeromonas simiae]|uniref:hypothetical protein n=1 Tax=Aeromonas simiae TaxID=218936 RepID=UPI0005A92AB0|nr:hypothetical protein [Aeromonas simiae]MDO2950055.1 hypothetical protein [Aeromonas simiae]MDO2953733.1 hypothetical protein [Aeromonas simiae]MDO2957426.1 hypothetical protein [Aeromonas simiae]